MGRLVSAVLWAVVGAVVAGGVGFAAIYLPGPASDPSAYGAAMLGGLVCAAVGFVVGAVYGAWRGGASARA